MLIAGVCFALVHAAVKFLPQIPSHELVVARAVVSLVITWFALKKVGLSPWGQNRPLLVFRGVAGTGALVLYFYTLQHMPLATAVTIQYLHPLLTVILAAFFLRERANWKQWVCFGASFVGVLLVRGFDLRVTPFDLALGVASATLSAVAYNLIRALRNEDHALVVIFYLPLVSLVTVGPWTAFHFVKPVGTEWLILIFIGVFTQVAQYFMTRAYQADSAANISNLNYLGILYASAIGFLFYDEAMMGLSIVGILIVVTSAVLSTRFASKKVADPTAETEIVA
jgi:drug/metabolite transporter (DMT)-like permease